MGKDSGMMVRDADRDDDDEHATRDRLPQLS